MTVCDRTVRPVWSDSLGAKTTRRLVETLDLVPLDEPSASLRGFVLNRPNLDRAVENARRRLMETDPELLLWDHRLLRDARCWERTRLVWGLQEAGYSVATVAEVHGTEPLMDRLMRG